MEASSSSQSQPSSFTANCDPSNPLDFLYKVFKFIAQTSDFFENDMAEEDIVTTARAAKEKLKEEAAEAAAAAVAAAAAEEEEKAKEAERKKEKKKDQESGLIVPNKGNGMNLEKYSWTQTLKEVNVSIPLLTRATSTFVIKIEENHMKVGFEGQPPIIDGELYAFVKTDYCGWDIGDENTISILLAKRNPTKWWKCVVKGDPEIDIQKVEPEKLYEMDPEIRKEIQKIMFGPSLRAMGLPSVLPPIDERQKQEILNRTTNYMVSIIGKHNRLLRK